MRKPFPFQKQLEGADCGPACLKMICDFYQQNIPLVALKKACPIDRNGTTLKGLSIVAETFGFRTNGVKVVFEGNEEEGGLLDVNFPCIAFWKQRHYVVVYRANKKYVWVADPAFDKKKYERKEFESAWFTDGNKGILLLLEPKPEFFSQTHHTKQRKFTHIFNYLRQFKRLTGQLFLGLVLSSCFALTLPFLTQMVVDKGIANQDIGLIYLLLIGQMILFFASTIIGFIQSWIFLHIGARINIALIHDFLIKLMKLPIPFFNRRVVGDLLQRVDDHQRINSFITSSSMNALFSFINIIVFSIVLLIYSVKLFALYWFLSLAYLLWILAFLKKRKELDYKSFELAATNQSKLIEIIKGIQEIRLQGSEKKRRWQWVNIQGKIFKLNIKSLVVSQFQGTGALFINQLKNIVVSFVAATSVIYGEISLGMMLAVQYIIGYINSPLESIVGFVQTGQDAKISFDRLNEIHDHEDEETDHNEKETMVPSDGNLILEDVSFRYSPEQNLALENINLEIPRNKITAIVGCSGSGKTTLIKLLLAFYKPTNGCIRIGSYYLRSIKNDEWRSHCGAVMQDGFIFPDTIAHNISESDEYVNIEKLIVAASTANVDEFVSLLPGAFNTPIGEHGINLSQGQIQRILIARAVYKNPQFLFFDEATNALDANNEKLIMENLQNFYQGRTVVVVAHRLSTVLNADQIVVLDRGRIVEVGKHKELVELGNHYHRLIHNQMRIDE